MEEKIKQNKPKYFAKIKNPIYLDKWALIETTYPPPLNYGAHYAKYSH